MSSLTGDSPTLNRAIQGEGIPYPSLKMPTITEPFYFNLFISEENYTFNEDSTQLKESDELEPGKKYKILVITDINELPGGIPVRIQENSILLLKLEGNSDALSNVIINNSQVEISPDNIFNAQYEFSLTVTDNLPRTEVEIELMYYRIKPLSRPILVTKRKVKLAGTYNPIDQDLLDQCKISLNINRPISTAILHIKNASDEKIEVIGWGYSSERVLHTTPFKPSFINLASFIENEIKPRPIRGGIRGFSNSNIHLGLIGWLKKLYEKYSNKLHLILVDHANSEIPWEMLQLDGDIYLGELFPITRWLPIPVPFQEEWRLLDLSEEKLLHGGIISFLDDITDSNSQKEQKILNQFNTNIYDNFDQFTHKIKESISQSNLALVYLGCHGIFSYSESYKISVRSWKNPKNIMSVYDFELLPYIDLNRPFVFINSCHSARVIKDGDSLCGLSIVLLKLIANGFIGTLGPVSSEFAVKIAEFIFKNIADSCEGVSLAETLRQLRIYAVEKIKSDDISDENKLFFIYTCMFVYFGNPLARLKLLPAKGTGEQDEHA